MWKDFCISNRICEELKTSKHVFITYRDERRSLKRPCVVQGATLVRLYISRTSDRATARRIARFYRNPEPDLRCFTSDANLVWPVFCLALCAPLCRPPSGPANTRARAPSANGCSRCLFWGVVYQDVYLVSYIDLGEAEGLQVNAGGPDGGSDGFHQQLLQILADEGPGLLDDLQEQIVFLPFRKGLWNVFAFAVVAENHSSDSQNRLFSNYSQRSYFCSF